MTFAEIKGGARCKLVSARTGLALSVVFTKLSVSVTPSEEEVERMASFKKEFNGKSSLLGGIIAIPDTFTARDDNGLLFPIPRFAKVVPV